MTEVACTAIVNTGAAALMFLGQLAVFTILLAQAGMVRHLAAPVHALRG